MGLAETRGAGASKNALNSPTRSANLEDCKRRCAIVGRVFRNSPGQIHLLSWSSGQEAAPQGRKIHPSASRRPAITASVNELKSTQNIARGPVPWRASVVVLAGIRSVLSLGSYDFGNVPSRADVPAAGDT